VCVPCGHPRGKKLVFGRPRRENKPTDPAWSPGGDPKRGQFPPAVHKQTSCLQSQRCLRDSRKSLADTFFFPLLYLPQSIHQPDVSAHTHTHTHTHTQTHTHTTKAANEQECPQIIETAREPSPQGGGSSYWSAALIGRRLFATNSAPPPHPHTRTQTMASPALQRKGTAGRAGDVSEGKLSGEDPPNICGKSVGAVHLHLEIKRCTRVVVLKAASCHGFIGTMAQDLHRMGGHTKLYISVGKWQFKGSKISPINITVSVLQACRHIQRTRAACWRIGFTSTSAQDSIRQFIAIMVLLSTYLYILGICAWSASQGQKKHDGHSQHPEHPEM